MNTFLPYSSFSKSAAVLDYKRLGKMRVEAWQLLRAIQGTTKGWANHPAAIMYHGYEAALCRYGLAMCDEWILRGYNDTMRQRFIDALCLLDDTGNPPWLGDKDFHIRHQSNLVRKNPQFYQPLFPSVSDNLEYKWPTP